MTRVADGAGPVAPEARAHVPGVLAAGALLVAASACSGPGLARGGGDPVPLAGETEQGLRMRIEVVGDREISLRIPVDCRRASGDVRSPALEEHPVRVTVDRDGTFEVEEDFVEDGADGNEDHSEVRVEGSFASGGSDDSGAAGGTATGTVEVRSRWWDAQAQEFSADCESGTVSWTARHPLRRGDDLVVPSEPTAVMQPIGSDILAISEADEVVSIDHVTGAVRRLGRPAAEAEAAAGLVVPGTTLSRRDGAAVVADGVWMADPTTRRITRTELADGRQTATVGPPGQVVEDLAAGHAALWTVSTDYRRSSHVLEKRDPIDGTVLATDTLPAEGRLIAGPTDMWLSYGTPDGQWLARIDPDTLDTLDTFEVRLELPPSEVTASEDRVWFISSQGLTSIEPTTGEQHDLALSSHPGGMAADEHGIWVTQPRESVVRRIEGDDVVRTVDSPGPWEQVAAADDGALWLTGPQPEGGDRGDDTAGGPDHAIVRLDQTMTGG